MGNSVPDNNGYCLINGDEPSELSSSDLAGRLVHDRGLHYADGVFRTVAVFDHQVVDLEGQLAKLAQDGQRLRMVVPIDRIYAEAMQLAQLQGQGVLKIILTRGTGPRGYAIPEHKHYNRILITSSAPPDLEKRAIEGIHTVLCDTVLGHAPVTAGIKHLNRVEHVLARSEWQSSDISEGLLLDIASQLISGVQSNLFLVKEDVVLTPLLLRCGVSGRVRERILSYTQCESIQTRETNLVVDDLVNADEVFVCNSLIGIWPVIQCESQGRLIGQWGIGTLTRKLQAMLDHPRLS